MTFSEMKKISIDSGCDFLHSETLKIYERTVFENIVKRKSKDNDYLFISTRNAIHHVDSPLFFIHHFYSDTGKIDTRATCYSTKQEAIEVLCDIVDNH